MIKNILTRFAKPVKWAILICMRIAIFTDTFLPQINGVVRSIVTTANTLARHGHEVAVFTINAETLSKSVRQKELDPLVEVHPFASFTLPTYKDIQVRVPTFGPALYQVYKFQPDLIHSHTTFGIGWEAVAAANALDVPLVGTHHGFLAEYLKHVRLDYAVMKNLTRRYMAFYYNRCDAVLTPSEALTKELRDYKLKRAVYVISNPMDLKYFSTTKSKERLRKKYHITKPVIIHCGRISYEKSIDVVVKAFSTLHEGGTDAELVIIGDGPERKKIETLCRKLGIERFVKFTGMLRGADLVERVAAGDLFVSASTTETQGLVFLEAMSLGLPVIGVDAGGVPEYVENKKNGLIVEPNNSKKLAEAMRTLVEDAKLREAFGAHARASVARYDADLIVSKIENVYKVLVRMNNTTL